MTRSRFYLEGKFVKLYSKRTKIFQCFGIDNRIVLGNYYQFSSWIFFYVICKNIFVNKKYVEKTHVEKYSD